MWREGCRLRPGTPETCSTRVVDVALPPALPPGIAPLLELLGPLNHQLEVLDQELERLVAAHEVARPLPTRPDVGSVTAARSWPPWSETSWATSIGDEGVSKTAPSHGGARHEIVRTSQAAA